MALPCARKTINLCHANEQLYFFNSTVILGSPQCANTDAKPDETVDVKQGDDLVDEDMMDATWSEVLTSCCTRTPKDWGLAFLGTCTALFFLFFFLVGTTFVLVS